MSSSNPFLTVYGHITVDQIVSVAKFPTLNETVDVVSKKTSLGGTGTNIALTAARLGVPTALSGFIGADFPAAYLDMMRESGLIMDEVETVDGYDTSQCTILNDSELKQKAIFYQGPQGFATQLNRELIDCASRSKYVHFCTGEPDYYIGLMKKLDKTDANVAMDPSQETYRLWPEEKLREALPASDCLFCNDFEAKVIEERLGLKSVLDLDKELVVCTQGAEGSMAKIGSEIVKIPCIKGNGVVDATGCGDSYRAGFYSGLYHGYSIKESLILASAVSSFIIEKVGALTNTPTWEQVEERAKPHLK